MSEKNKKVKLEAEVEKKVIEIPKHKESIFNNLIKKITRYCKFLQLPLPKINKLDDKPYYAISIYHPVDGDFRVNQKTVTDDFEEIKKKKEEISKKTGNNKNVKIVSQDVSVYEIEIIDEIKPDNEWEILGVIDHEEGLLIPAPDKQVPYKLIPSNLHDSSHCDHCQTKRYRTKTIYVQNKDTKEIKRVGGSCIRYYLGYDYERILNIITALNLFQTTFDTGGGYWDEDDWFGGFGRRYNPDDEMVDVKDIVKYFFWYVNNYGYTSKSAAERYNAKVSDNDELDQYEKETKYKKSTSNVVNSYLRYIYIEPISYGSKNDKKYYEMWLEDNKEYNEILSKASDEYFELVKNFVEERYKDNNFLFNSMSFFKNGSVKIKHMRYIVSACSMYWGMQLAEKAKKEAEKARQNALDKMKVSEFIGTVGEKEKLENLKITNISGFETQYGWSHVYRLVDEDGNIFTKFGTINKRFITEDSPIKEIKEGAIVSFTAEIKKHDTWKDIKQTILGRLSKI